MDSQTIERRLETLTKMKQRRANIADDYALVKEALTPPEVRSALADVDAEYAPVFQRMNADIEAIEAEIKEAVAAHGATVTGGGLMAQFNSGRVTYDSKRLDGLALAFPQINECKKVGEPFVTLKPVKG